MGIGIEYRRTGRLPTCIGNERIRIGEDGQVFHSRNTVECDDGQTWSSDWTAVGRLDAAAMASLADDLRASGILGLAARSTDDTAEGGAREEIDLTIDGRKYHWVVQNAAAPAFRAVVARLWGVVHSLAR